MAVVRAKELIETSHTKKVSASSLAEFREIVNALEDVDERQPGSRSKAYCNQQTLLMIASSWGDIEAVRFLLQRKASPLEEAWTSNSDHTPVNALGFAKINAAKDWIPPSTMKEIEEALAAATPSRSGNAWEQEGYGTNDWNNQQWGNQQSWQGSKWNEQTWQGDERSSQRGAGQQQWGEKSWERNERSWQADERSSQRGAEQQQWDEKSWRGDERQARSWDAAQAQTSAPPATPRREPSAGATKREPATEAKREPTAPTKREPAEAKPRGQAPTQQDMVEKMCDELLKLPEAQRFSMTHETLERKHSTLYMKWYMRNQDQPEHLRKWTLLEKLPKRFCTPTDFLQRVAAMAKTACESFKAEEKLHRDAQRVLKWAEDWKTALALAPEVKEEPASEEEEEPQKLTNGMIHMWHSASEKERNENRKRARERNKASGSNKKVKQEKAESDEDIVLDECRSCFKEFERAKTSDVYCKSCAILQSKPRAEPAAPAPPAASPKVEVKVEQP